MDGCDADRTLIPGLPDDIALDCLARVPLRFHSALLPVSRRWHLLITSPAFSLHRRRIAAAEDLILLIQAQTPADPPSDDPLPTAASDDTKHVLHPPPCALVVFNASTGEWRRAAAPVPVFARVAAAAGKVVVVGGWDPASLEPVGEVRVVDPVSGCWRSGKPMAAARSFFACAAAGSRVYVAGGHDGQKNAMKTAEEYDVAADYWSALPAMVEERDECVGAAVGGQFWAVSGYQTEGQGQFDPAAECYDPVTKQWSKIDGVWDGGAAPCAAFFAGDGGRMGYVDGRGVREYNRESGWKEKEKGPEGMRSAAVAVAMGGVGDGERVFVMGTETDRKGVAGWTSEKGKWRRVSVPAGFSGSVYSAAAIRI